MDKMSRQGGLIYALGDLVPKIDPTAWIAPTAVLIGDVRIGPGASIWYHCVLRGDTNPVIVGARSNLQDGTVVHVDHGDNPAIIGDDVTVGHAAIIHACRLKAGAFVGMGATVMDGAVIEEEGLLGARGLLGPGKRIRQKELWAGSPARFVRVMGDEERARWAEIGPHYQQLARRHANDLKLVT